MEDTAVAPVVAEAVPAVVETNEALFQRGFDKGLEPAVVPEEKKVEPSEVVAPQPVVKPEPVVAPVEKAAEVPVKKPVEISPATPEKLTREERVDEKRPDDPVALEHWNRWKTATGLIEKEKSRSATLEAELAKERAARITPSEPAKPEQKTDDILDSLEEQYMDALVENDRDAAKRIRNEIDGRKFRKLQEDTDARTTQIISSERAQQSVEAVAAEAYVKYPALNTKAENADIVAINAVKAQRWFYEEQGFSAPEALRKAIADVAPRIFQVAGPAPTVLAVPEVVKSPVDEAALKSMAPVQVKTKPVRTDQKPKGSGTYEDGFNKFFNKT